MLEYVYPDLPHGPFAMPVRVMVLFSVGSFIGVLLLILLKIYDTIATFRAYKRVAETLTLVKAWAASGAKHSEKAANAVAEAAATVTAKVESTGAEIKAEVPKATVEELRHGDG